MQCALRPSQIISSDWLDRDANVYLILSSFPLPMSLKSTYVSALPKTSAVLPFVCAYKYLLFYIPLSRVTIHIFCLFLSLASAVHLKNSNRSQARWHRDIKMHLFDHFSCFIWPLRWFKPHISKCKLAGKDLLCTLSLANRVRPKFSWDEIPLFSPSRALFINRTSEAKTICFVITFIWLHHTNSWENTNFPKHHFQRY